MFIMMVRIIIIITKMFQWTIINIIIMFMCRKSLLSGSQWLSLANNQDRNDKQNQDHLGLIIRFTSVIMIICQRNKMIMQIILQADFLKSHHYHQNNIGNLNHMTKKQWSSWLCTQDTKWLPVEGIIIRISLIIIDNHHDHVPKMHQHHQNPIDPRYILVIWCRSSDSVLSGRP